eukprot:1859246-Rhodomonas_salina.2
MATRAHSLMSMILLQRSPFCYAPLVAPPPLKTLKTLKTPLACPQESLRTRRRTRSSTTLSQVCLNLASAALNSDSTASIYDGTASINAGTAHICGCSASVHGSGAGPLGGCGASVSGLVAVVLTLLA